MISVRADLGGLDALIRALEGKGRAEVTKAMGEAILAGADERVPRDSGDLAKTGRVVPLKGGATAVRYGDEGVKYAAAVHESPSIQPKSGTKRFLRESAMDGKRVTKAAAAAARKIIERAGPKA